MGLSMTGIRDFIVDKVAEQRNVEFKMTASGLNLLLYYIKNMPYKYASGDMRKIEEEWRAELEKQIKEQLVAFHHKLNEGIKELLDE